MICILLVAGHGTVLEAQIKNDETGLYSHLSGVPKALLPGIGGKKILDFWWETVNMRQLFTAVYLVTNADKYKHYERWATASDFPVENIINDGSTTLEDRLGAVADLELVVRSRKLQDDIMVIAGDMLCADQNFDIAQVIRFFRSKPGELIIYYELEEGEKSSSRGIVEVCHDSHRVTRFLEKPQEGQTASQLASVVFYCIQRDTLSYTSDFLSQQPQTVGRTFGQFWEWLINEKQCHVFGMKVPTGFQLIGQVGLSDYTKWLAHYSTKQQGSPAKPITCRSYARVGLMGNPSDGFNGKTIAMTIANFWAEVTLLETQTLVLVPHPLNDPTEFGSLQDLFCISRKEGCVCSQLTEPSGELLVCDAMRRFAELTDQARTAFRDKDWRRLVQLMDQNFELRRSVYTDDCLGPGNLKMVELARQFGSAVKLPGSGGAVVGLCLDQARLVRVRCGGVSVGL
ncbi:glucuronokinase with putative uridyl pyrophosphorylase [Neolamprologus brichardi]|uniref:glucuronokinase with putative uridyl pyrophosphorylase n=1 Tax=Neolamprologus brichardi TaxID=32507 RepID=UPI0003EC374C|nr:glucuronokinase with putative uridyl pyrophosphorylase [Neolamprologus brichardi]